MVSLNRLPRKLRPDRKKHQNLPPDNGKIGKEAFLYMEGKEGDDSFAQCSECWQWNNVTQRCSILGPDFFVDADDSCGFFVKGAPHDQPCVKRVTPEEAGFVDRDVRCSNCAHAKGNKCNLFDILNKTLPDLFDLDISIKAEGCCNAQTAKK